MILDRSAPLFTNFNNMLYVTIMHLVDPISLFFYGIYYGNLLVKEIDGHTEMYYEGVEMWE